MKSRVVLVAILSLSLLVTAGAPIVPTIPAAPTGTDLPADMAKSPPPAKWPQPKGPLNSFKGVVTAVDGSSITIQGFGASFGGQPRVVSNDRGTVRVLTGNPVKVRFPDRMVTCPQVVITREVLTLTSVTGQVTVIRRADLPPRQFKAAPALAAGGFPPDAVPSHTYRLADVRVGDEVHITCTWLDDADGCHAICIERRPGGRVPQAPGEGPDPKPWPYHERANAYQDLEEKGIPLPEKFTAWEREINLIRPSGDGPHRQPGGDRKPGASPPQEVKPPIPPAK